jgi:Fe-S-cluster containining protein
LSREEVASLESYTSLKLDEFANPKDKDGKGHFLKFHDTGDCVFLKEENGRYSCSVYLVRPGICKNYPSNTIQDNVCENNCKEARLTNLP